MSACIPNKSKTLAGLRGLSAGGFGTQEPDVSGCVRMEDHRTEVERIDAEGRTGAGRLTASNHRPPIEDWRGGILLANALAGGGGWVARCIVAGGQLSGRRQLSHSFSASSANPPRTLRFIRGG